MQPKKAVMPDGYGGEAHAGAAEAAKRPVVLVVDDEARVRRSLERTLARDGLEVLTAADGDAALRAVAERAPHAILLDVNLPGRGGFEVCEAIRALPQGREVPVVMMTARDDEESIRRAYEAGATDFLTKPASPAIVRHRLRYLLRATENLAELRRSRSRLERANRLARLASWELEIGTGRFDGSEQLWELLGIDPRRAATIRSLAELVPPEDRELLLEAARRCMTLGESTTFDHRVITADGSERVLRCQMAPQLDADGEPFALLGVSQDVTERHRAEHQLQFLAFNDPLTGLGNRRWFEQRAFLAVHDARGAGGRVAILVVDLDHLKRVNDSLGHAAGDMLLRAAAERLLSCVRNSDLGRRCEELAVARLGGDEFCVLIPAVPGDEALERLASSIHEALARPFPLGAHDHVLSCSIGIAIHPDHASDAEALLRNADAALSRAKSEARGSHRFYDPNLTSVELRRLALESRLRRALERDEFELYYQPKIELQTGEIVGFEGLVRWHEPELGLVYPGDFIPIAEETGLIERLGDWIFREACRQVADWSARGVCEAPVAVNLSPLQFRRKDLARHLGGIVRESGAPPGRLGVEVTESIVLHDADVVIRELEGLRELGLTVALDDFGTGYSSLSYLRRLPVDTVKIDRSFIQEIGRADSAAALTASIVNMGKALGLKVVAEGVEEDQQRQLLTIWGCDEMQGYLFSRPVPAADVEQLWRRRAD